MVIKKVYEGNVQLSMSFLFWKLAYSASAPFFPQFIEFIAILA